MCGGIVTLLGLPATAPRRAEQKADWDYWANRITLALALIGSIFGVLAFFKK